MMGPLSDGKKKHVRDRVHANVHIETSTLYLSGGAEPLSSVPQDAGAKIALTIIYNGIKASSYSNNVVYNTVLCV